MHNVQPTNQPAGNRQWVERRKQEDPDFFNKLGETQKPKYLYFGCSDSRVPANEILGLGPGTVFIHRNIGNLVPGKVMCVSLLPSSF